MSEILSIIEEDNRQPSQITSDLGARGERLAAEYLVSNGYRLVVANFKVPIGRNRRASRSPARSILSPSTAKRFALSRLRHAVRTDFTPVLPMCDTRKQRQIIRAANVYLRIFNIRGHPLSIRCRDHSIAGTASARIELIKGFWNESKFRKRAWADDLAGICLNNLRFSRRTVPERNNIMKHLMIFSIFVFTLVLGCRGLGPAAGVDRPRIYLRQSGDMPVLRSRRTANTFRS